MGYKTEKYAIGKFDVISTGAYPSRIGHICGAKTTWHAESGHVDLGYHKTKKKALEAIVAEYERPQAEVKEIPLASLKFK